MSKSLWDNAAEHEPEDGEYVDTDDEDLEEEDDATRPR